MSGSNLHDYQDKKPDASVIHDNYWPSSNQDHSDDEDDAPQHQAKRGSGGKSSKIFQSILKGFGQSSAKKAAPWGGYHRDGILPDSKRERERNDLQHVIMAKVWGGQTFLSPAVKPMTVLDVGTGSGLWALEFGQNNPGSRVLGIDIAPSTPPFHVPNCRFETMDVTEPWKIDPGFDFIHARGLPDFPGPTRQAVFDAMWDHLNPGGWLELTNWIFKLRSPNHSTEGSRLEEWYNLIEKAISSSGGYLHFPKLWPKYMGKKHAKHITVRRYPVPLNAWAPSKSSQEIGNMMAKNTLSLIGTGTPPAFSQGLDWADDMVKSIVADCHRELPDPKYHSYMIL
ncbi:S-adenosyl-L-methionine-dependent methyltransferase [Apiospora sp. TS-2023a]